MILDENLFAEYYDEDKLKLPFRVYMDGTEYTLNEEEIGWIFDDLSAVDVSPKDIVKYEGVGDADYFKLTFKDGSQKAWYIHSGMYIPDRDFEESLKEDFRDYEITQVEIKNGVTSIPRGAFYKCYSLQKVYIPDSVQSIEKSAFEDCKNLRSIDLPNSLRTIKNSAFYGAGLESISIPASVTVIDNYAFGACDNLQVVEILSLDAEIYLGIFDNCTSLKIARVLPESSAEEYFKKNEPSVKIEYIGETNESLEEDYHSEPMWGTIYYYQDNKKKILDHADFDSGKDLYNELKDFYMDPHYKDCECVVGGKGWSCSLKDFLNEYESTNESLKEDLAAYIQKLHDEDEYLWNLHDTDYTWLYDELDKYSDDWRESDSKYSIADVIRMMPKEEQSRIYDRLVKPYTNESLTEDLTFNNKEVELIKKYLEKELGHTWTDRDDEKQIRLILNKIHNKDESLKEDFDEVVAIEVPDVNVEIEAEETKPEGPAPGADTGITDLLLSLINDENSTIQTYNSFKASLEDHSDFDDVINDIVAEEYNHVGMLQTLLKKISPNSVTIDAGEEEAEDILTKEDNDSLEYGEIIGEIDDSFDNGFGGIFA